MDLVVLPPKRMGTIRFGRTTSDGVVSLRAGPMRWMATGPKATILSSGTRMPLNPRRPTGER